MVLIYKINKLVRVFNIETGDVNPFTYTDYNIIQEAQTDISSALYYNKETKTYLTLFKKGKPHLYRLFKDNLTLLETICPLIEGLIFEDNNDLQGYVMKEGESLAIPGMRDEFNEFLNSIQPALITLLQISPHYFYCDIHMDNVISLDNKFGLIDLSSFIPISQGNREDIVPNVRNHLTEYGDEVLNLLSSKIARPKI